MRSGTINGCEEESPGRGEPPRLPAVAGVGVKDGCTSAGSMYLWSGYFRMSKIVQNLISHIVLRIFSTRLTWPSPWKFSDLSCRWIGDCDGFLSSVMQAHSLACMVML